jgi:hypothetical protein
MLGLKRKIKFLQVTNGLVPYGSASTVFGSFWLSNQHCIQSYFGLPSKNAISNLVDAASSCEGA